MSHQFARLAAPVGTALPQRRPAYVERGGELVTRHPFDAHDTTMWTVPLPVDPGLVQRYCDRTFTEPSGGRVRFRPVGRQALLVVARIGRLVSSERPDEHLGRVTEQEVGLWLPLRDGAGRLVWTIPYLFVDQPAPLLGGREIYGFPKQLGVITCRWRRPDGGDVQDRHAAAGTGGTRSGAAPAPASQVGARRDAGDRDADDPGADDPDADDPDADGAAEAIPAEPPPDDDPPAPRVDLASVDVEAPIVVRFGRDEDVRPRRVLTITHEPRADGEGHVVTRTVAELLAALGPVGSSSLPAWLATAVSRLATPLDAPGLLAGLLAAVDVGEVPVVLLKQFRDATDPRLACYQAIVEVVHETRRLSTVEALPGWVVQTVDVDGLPLGRELGLPGQRHVADVGLRLDLGFATGLGRVLWEAGT